MPDLTPRQLRGLALMALAADRRSGGIGGQMVSEWTCALCDGPGVHGSTAVPLLCGECRKQMRELAAPQVTNAERPER